VADSFEAAGSAAKEDPFRKEKLVAHFKDGAVSRGYSRDFRPDAEIFHLESRDAEIASSRKIHLDQLKALFQVKTWGSRGKRHDRRKEFPPEPGPEIVGLGSAARTIIEFYDGEEIWGYSQGYRSDAPGFFLIPADPQTNNERIFVVTSSLANIQFLDN